MIRRIVTNTVGLGAGRGIGPVVTVAVLLVLTALSTLVTGGKARADQQFQKAAAELKKTEQKIVATVGQEQQVVKEMISKPVGSPEGMENVRKQLKQLGSSNDSLQSMEQQLRGDVEAFEAARGTKVAEFDKQLEAITDPLLKRQMQRIRERVQRDSGRALSAAKTALAELHAVLAQGSDIDRVAKCIQLSGELDASIQDLQSQVQQVKTFAAEYSQRAGALLATLSQTGAESAGPAGAE